MLRIRRRQTSLVEGFDGRRRRTSARRPHSGRPAYGRVGMALALRCLLASRFVRVAGRQTLVGDSTLAEPLFQTTVRSLSYDTPTVAELRVHHPKVAVKSLMRSISGKS